MCQVIEQQMGRLNAPQHTFETIVGQDLVKRFLLGACEHECLPHALLFTGPEGVGKRSLMYALAKRLVTHGLEPGSEKAQRACGKVERGTHPDVLVVEPKSASGQILKGQVDEMQERAYYAPLESPNKVILIAPIEAMNVVAANNLLKLLEEPPPSLYIVLCTQQINLVLTTIRSRCALLRCPPVEFGVLSQWLSEIGRCSLRRSQTAAALSGGRPGLALDFLSGENEERRRRMVGELEFFDREGYPSIFRVGRNLLDTHDGSPADAMTGLLTWFRDLLVVGLLTSGQATETQCEEMARQSLLVNRDLAAEVAEASRRHSPQSLARAVQVILEQNDLLSRPFLDSDLLMEVFLTELGIALK